MAREKGRRVIFTGPTGVEKKTVLRKLADEYFSVKELSIKAEDPDAQRFFQRFSVEEEIKGVMGADHIMVFLDEPKYSRQKSIWKGAIKRLSKKVRKLPPQVNVLIEFHTCYFLGQKRLRFWDLSEINSLKPTDLITLLDDSYSIRYRVDLGERKHSVGSYLRLQDIIDWRRTEVLLSDLVAASLKIKNFIVPVKHPRQVLHRLLFKRGTSLLIYAAYPITEPRKPEHQPEGRKEIDEHRYFLHGKEHYVVFDPLSIDERALQFAFERRYGEKALINPPNLTQKQIHLESQDRWPLVSRKFPPMVSDPPDIFPLPLPAEEVYTVISRPVTRYGEEQSFVDSQIQERDFRYIRDVDRVTAYRPYWRGIESKGVYTEIEYARGLAPISVYHPEKDRLLKIKVSPLAPPLRGLPVFAKKQDFYDSISTHCTEKFEKPERSESP